jgi:hypothetical protein
LFWILGLTITPALCLGRPGEGKLQFSVHGMKDKKMYSWIHYQMQKGNRIEVRIVETENTDEPKETKCSGWKRPGGRNLKARFGLSGSGVTARDYESKFCTARTRA